MLKRFLQSRGWMLTIGSAAASAFNFYSYVVFPARFGIGSLDRFVQDNYLGGLYLFGIASSMAPFSMFVLTSGRRPALMRYVGLSVAGAIAIGAGGFWLARFPWSYLCLAGAILMHGAGFFLASMIRFERIMRAALLQVLQPLIFAILITLEHFMIVPHANWAMLYLLSAIACFAGFFLFTDRAPIRSAIQMLPSVPVKWRDIASRVGLSVGFPLFFQLELILCGKLSTVNVGLYAVLQKLYSSVSISLFGSVGVLLLVRSAEQLSSEIKLIDRSTLILAGMCAMCVPVVGAVCFYTGRGKLLDVQLIAMTAVLAFLFTLCSLASLRLNTFRPFIGLKAFAASITIYAAAFIAWRPNSAFKFLVISGIFFSTFLTVSLFLKGVSRPAEGPEEEALEFDLATGAIDRL